VLRDSNRLPQNCQFVVRGGMPICKLSTLPPPPPPRAQKVTCCQSIRTSKNKALQLLHPREDGQVQVLVAYVHDYATNNSWVYLQIPPGIEMGLTMGLQSPPVHNEVNVLCNPSTPNSMIQLHRPSQFTEFHTTNAHLKLL
jgi:hypothetical protein